MTWGIPNFSRPRRAQDTGRKIVKLYRLRAVGTQYYVNIAYLRLLLALAGARLRPRVYYLRGSSLLLPGDRKGRALLAPQRLHRITQRRT